MNKYYLFPGKLAAFKEETVISTLLGSCVAVALYDPDLKIGGLNHYLLPELGVGDSANARYGTVAIESLIEEMQKLGGSKNRLQAKIYGGGNVIAVSQIGQGIGRRNIEVAEEILKKHGIRVVERNVGGESGRTIKFNTATFEVQHALSTPTGGESSVEAVDVSGFRPLSLAKTIKVLIVDDSATVRTLFATIFKKAGFEVVGAVADAYQAREAIVAKKPDVLTLDIEMPGMSGVAFLEKVMQFQPLPVVMVSSLGNNGEAAMKSLELGAVEFVHKPSQFDPEVLRALAQGLVDKVRAAASTNVLKQLKERAPAVPVAAAAMPSKRKKQELKVVVVGGNAGSVPALETFLEGLAADTPPVVIACSLVTNFLESFLQKMKNKTKVKLARGKDGEWLQSGTAYLVPGGVHGVIVSSNGTPQLKLESGAGREAQIPSVNILFNSAGQSFQGGVYAILLSGFGWDGVEGLNKIQDQGGMTVVQNPEESQFPYTPQKAIELGVAEDIQASQDLAQSLLRYRNQSVF